MFHAFSQKTDPSNKNELPRLVERDASLRPS
jgi:hypothetical protein